MRRGYSATAYLLDVGFVAMKSHVGFSLIELLIATALSLLLLAGVIHLFVQQRETYRWQEAAAQLQENARLIIQTLHHDIRLAGYIGCARLDNQFPLFNGIPQNLSAQTTLIAYSADDRMLPDNVRKRILPGTDALLVQSIKSNSSSVLAINGSRLLINHSQFKQGDSLLISDCTQAEIFQVASVNTSMQQQWLMPVQSLHYQYAVGALIGLPQRLLFYLGNTGRQYTTGRYIPALYRLDLNNPYAASELAEGVQAMQFKFIVMDSETRQMLVVARAQVIDWSQVRAVDIHLNLLESLQGSKDPRQFLQNNWDTLIGLRERML